MAVVRGGAGSGGGGSVGGGGNFQELMQLLEQDIPKCRRHLQDSHVNLDKVAAYCLSNYQQAQDKRGALEETKNYTTQSLASVAYQINMLATNFLHLLDLQMVQISDMESSINHLSQIVMIHKEKVARREIGELTTNKATTRPPGVKNPGIIFPEHAERPEKYVRRAIDYTALDHIGHGVRPQQQQQVRRNSASTQRQAVGGPGGQVVPGQAPSNPPTPSPMYAAGMAGQGMVGAGAATGGTLRKASTSSPYRSPAPHVAPPTVPGNYGPGYGATGGYAPGGGGYPAGGGGVVNQGGSLSRGSGYALAGGGMMMMQQGGGQMRMGAPAPQQYQGGSPLPHQGPHGGGAGLPPNLMHGQQPYISDPIPMGDYRSSGLMGNMSPPLPPPPTSADSNSGRQFTIQPPNFGAGGGVGHGGGGNYGGAPPGGDYGGQYGGQENFASRMSRMEQDDTDWIPASYLEKVIAIYNYSQDKDDELTFDEGAVIYVVKKNDDGWWEGVMEGRTGLFPGNYVEPCI